MSDWSADVCSSDLPQRGVQGNSQGGLRRLGGGTALVVVRPLLDQLEIVVAELPKELLHCLQGTGVIVGVERVGRGRDNVGELADQREIDGQIGRASGRERVCQYV